MTRPSVRQVVARAWQIGPTWPDVAALAAVDVALIWWGVPWLPLVAASVVACAVLFGLLGWLDLQNEDAGQAGTEEEGD